MSALNMMRRGQNIKLTATGFASPYGLVAPAKTLPPFVLPINGLMYCKTSKSESAAPAKQQNHKKRSWVSGDPRILAVGSSIVGAPAKYTTVVRSRRREVLEVWRVEITRCPRI
jgi:hypothetical protein